MPRFIEAHDGSVKMNACHLINFIDSMHRMNIRLFVGAFKPQMDYKKKINCERCNSIKTISKIQKLIFKLILMINVLPDLSQKWDRFTHANQMENTT